MEVIEKPAMLSREELNEWFELQQVCDQCGQLFIPDFKYVKLCHTCRHTHLGDYNTTE